jgi:cytochrome c oxidase assembly factor CtaG
MSVRVDASGWPVPPTILLVCLLAEILYFRGWQLIVKGVQAKEAARIRNPAVFGDSHAGTDQWRRWFWRGIFFPGAVFALLIASSALVDTFAGRFFWVHMIQHLLMLVVIPPLLVASAPLLPLWLGLPRRIRRLVARLRVGRAFYHVGHRLRQPAITCALFIIGIWAWHWPPLYDLALTNTAIHDWCEHATFLAVGVLFWSQVIPSPPLRLRTGYLGRIGCVGVAIAQNLVLSILIGFAQVPLYAPYAHLAAASGGLSALHDQQLGAGIMWTFGDVPFGIAFSMLVHQWLSSQSDEPARATTRVAPTMIRHDGPGHPL